MVVTGTRSWQLAGMEPATRVLSGIQPSGTKHLGNYFGAIRQHIALQNEHPGECFYFIADYHSLTTLRDAEALRTGVIEVARTYLALGLDPDVAQGLGRGGGGQGHSGGQAENGEAHVATATGGVGPRREHATGRIDRGNGPS